MANTVPPPKEVMKPRKEVRLPSIDLHIARSNHPTLVADENRVIEAFRIQSSKQYVVEELRLPDYVLEQGSCHLFPFYGSSVKDLIASASRLKVKVRHDEYKDSDTLLSMTCSIGWSLISQKPVQAGAIRSHNNGYRYRALSFADALMFFIWRMSLGAEPFVANQTDCVHFVEKGSHVWIQFDKESRTINIQDAEHGKSWCHSALQQIGEVN